MNKRRKEIVGVVLMSIALICIVSILFYTGEQPGGSDTDTIDNKLGIFGVYVGHLLYFYLLGYYSIFLCIIICLIGFSLFSNKSMLVLTNLF